MTAFMPWGTGGSTGSLVAGIVTNRLAETCEFYRQLFGFRAISGDGDAMVLARDDGTRLALLRAGNFDQPAALQSATRGTGLWLELEVDDVDARFAQVGSVGAEIVAPLELAAATARRFIVRDPNGVLVVVVERLLADLSVSSPTRQLTHRP